MEGGGASQWRGPAGASQGQKMGSRVDDSFIGKLTTGQTGETTEEMRNYHNYLFSGMAVSGYGQRLVALLIPNLKFCFVVYQIGVLRSLRSTLTRVDKRTICGNTW